MCLYEFIHWQNDQKKDRGTASEETYSKQIRNVYVFDDLRIDMYQFRGAKR